MVSAITERLNHHSIYNGYVKVPNSEFPVEFNYESVSDPDTPLIKSIGDDEMDHLMVFFHSEYDEYILDVDIQMLQD